MKKIEKNCKKIKKIFKKKQITLTFKKRFYNLKVVKQKKLKKKAFMTLKSKRKKNYL